MLRANADVSMTTFDADANKRWLYKGVAFFMRIVLIISPQLSIPSPSWPPIFQIKSLRFAREIPPSLG